MSRTSIPSDVFFRGRPGDIRLGEWVVPVETLPPLDRKKREAVLIGYPDDQGVKRNRGRAGAALGPDSIRRQLYKMTIPADHRWEDRFAFYDYGNALVSPKLSETHGHAEKLAAQVAASGCAGVVLGGGHDFAAPTFRGFKASAPKARWGLINIDPHLDTRELEGDDAHSGNPFRVLIDGKHLAGSDFVEFGARASRNTRAAWEYCVEKKVAIHSLESLRAKSSPVPQLFKQALTKLTQKCRHVGVTIDLDCCPDAEGMSAAPVLGFSAWELCCFAATAGSNPRVAYLEIAEVAPALDVSERSSRIAAEVIFAFLDARSRLR